jgi:RNA polymerase sigma-70 factor, ECF subfamily
MMGARVTPLLAHTLRRDPRPRDPKHAFEAIYRHYLRDVYGLSLGILGNVQDAEDVTQTTFLNAYRALEGGKKVENMRAWLLAIAHNVCRQRFRAASRRPQEAELRPEEAGAVPDDEAPSVHEIHDAMKHLSFNQRTVLVLREIQGLTYEQIAETMDLSLSATETLLFRARQALREQLEAAENDLGCDAVQRLISLQLDGRLARPDRRLLRAHLRSCAECRRFSRSQRARKRAMPGLVAAPLPFTLTGAFETGAGAILTSKAAATVATAVLVTTGTLMVAGVVSLPGSAEGRAPIGFRADEVVASTANERASLEPRNASGTTSAGGTTRRAGKGQGQLTATGTDASKPRPGAAGVGSGTQGGGGLGTSGGDSSSTGDGGSPTADGSSSTGDGSGAPSGESTAGGEATQSPPPTEETSESAPNPVAVAAHGMRDAAKNVVAAAQSQTDGDRAESVVPAAHAMVGAAQNVVSAAHDKKPKP